MEVDKRVEQVVRFLDDTQDARVLSEKCRDYFDHKQWTDREIQVLKSRQQAPIVVNRLRPKIKGLVGLYSLRQSDPKAYARTQKHEESSHAVTDALRFVADNNDFQDVKRDVAEEFFVEGYSGVIIDTVEKKNDIEVRVQHIPWDRIYFDPHSRNKDFSDATYMGFYMWLYKEQIAVMFPDADIDHLFSLNYYTDETTEDRPRWVERNANRARIAFDFSQVKGKWEYSVFTEGMYLVKPIDSPYLDEDGEPSNPIELVSANVDRNNNRYGEAAGFLDLQKEINSRRSKFLHMMNSRQTFSSQKGAGDADVKKFKRELKKPDGHLEFQDGEFGKDFGIVPTNDMAQGQIELYQDGKAELDSVSFNAQLAGERQSGDLSGRAIDKLQAAGTVELNQDYALLANWEKRVYRQKWCRIKHNWTAEKWIRVTDDQDNLKWVGLNSQVTAKEWLEEKINDESLDILTRRNAAASYQALNALLQNPQTAQQGQAALDQLVDIKNAVPELDVDIILDQSFDTINAQQEQFQALLQFAQGSDVDVVELIELSQIRGKDELIEKIEKRRAAQAEAAGNVAQKEAQALDADIMVKATQADQNQAKADQTKIENQLLIANPTPVTSVAV